MVVDSSALIVVLRREPLAEAFLQTIAEADGCLLSAVGLLATSTALAGRQADANSWTELDALIVEASIKIVPQNAALTEIARLALVRHTDLRLVA